MKSASATRRRRPHTIQPFTRPVGNINITPLVDVVLVLLIIFMVVTPLLEKDIQIEVPKTEKVEDPTDVPDTQILVRLSKDNKLSINGTEVTMDRYKAILKYEMTHRSEALQVIFLLADDEASYGKMVEIVDTAKDMGVRTIGMSTGTEP